MVFADPPYNLSNDGTSVHAGKRVSVNKGIWDKSRGVSEDFDFHYSWIEACHRLLKPEGTIWISGTYHSIYACGHALQLQGWRILNDIAWYKPNAAPNLGCRMFTASHETLLWASKGKTAKHTFNYHDMRDGDFENDFIKKAGKQMRSVWSIATPGKSEKHYGKHPTQKPLRLLHRIILASTRPGNVILDPFCGSATTGVAALNVGGGGGEGSLASNPIENIWTNLLSPDFATLSDGKEVLSDNGTTRCCSEATKTGRDRLTQSCQKARSDRLQAKRQAKQGVGRPCPGTALGFTTQLCTGTQLRIMGAKGDFSQASTGGPPNVQGNNGCDHD